MMKKTINHFQIIRNFSLLLLLHGFLLSLSAQEEPPRPMKVSTYQHLSFGAFINASSGGTVTIDAGGSRSVTGDIIPVFQGMQYHPAIFEVEANPGVIISLMSGASAVLSGSNGGTLLLNVGNSLPVSPFVNTTQPPFRTQVMVGGTITVGSMLASPAGNYTGEFFITFIQQ
ncbi:MAG: DUF4402 domain-containing protein [Lentimicrobium sp.]|jgi:hypothetical protein|nr:DUF4402 domain-containing protein [Lentimicrobium sp.]